MHNMLDRKKSQHLKLELKCTLNDQIFDPAGFIRAEVPGPQALGVQQTCHRDGTSQWLSDVSSGYHCQLLNSCSSM